MTPLTGARRLVAAGNSLVAVPPDGRKHPAASWKIYQQRRPTDAELVAWFAAGRNGPAVVNGRVSGNRETLDFDRADLYLPWRAEVERRCPGLTRRLAVVRTPRPGFQVHTRCVVEIEGNRPLARQAKTPTGDDPAPFVTLIETRGEGGLALTPYCPGPCHPSGRRYELLQGDFDQPAVLTSEQRAVLVDAARAFNRYTPPPMVTGPAGAQGAAGDRPGDRFNARAGWRALLERHRWRPLYAKGETTLWQRPGKAGRGGSATTNFAGSNLLFVFSTNAAPFEPDTSYSLFAAYALLEHGGDFSGAARALLLSGYGRPGQVVQGPDGLRRRLFVPAAAAPTRGAA